MRRRALVHNAGSRLVSSRANLFRDRVVETRLVEDLRKCAPDGSRMRSVSVGGSVVAIVWDKTIGGGTALVSVLDVDLTALGLA